jgi:uncharacterized membrane protein YuzA (DUF378 family)
MRTLDVITLVLVIIGALNWGLVGLFSFDLVAAIAGQQFGQLNWFSRLIFILVGLSGIYQIFAFGRLTGRSVSSRM